MSFASHEPFQLTGRYAARNRWEVLNGPSDSRVTGKQIIIDEKLTNAWSDKVIFITGVSAGIGVETVRALATTGATIYGTARNIAKAEEAIGSPTISTGRIHLLHMDHTGLSSVRSCAAEFLHHCPSKKLHILINNAAVMNTPHTITRDGHELQFQTNHLAHFLLFSLLCPTLLASSTPAFHSRVVSVSSAGHLYSPLNLSDPDWQQGTYNGWLAYGSSKTATIYMSNQIDRLYGPQGLHGYSVHPGAFESPNLQIHSIEEMKVFTPEGGNERMQKYLSSMEQACATTVYGAVSADLEGKGGLYLEDRCVPRGWMGLSMGMRSGRLMRGRRGNCGR